MSSMDNINDTGFDEFNAILAGSISLIFNIILILATSKVKIYSEAVKRLQIFTSVLRLLFSMTVVLCSPTLAYVIEAEAVYIVKGGFSMGIPFGKFLLILFITFVIFSCLGPPMQFIQVVFIVNKTSQKQNRLVFITTITSFIIAFTATLLIYIGYSPTDDDDKLSQEIVYYLNGKGKSAYLIASLECFDYELNDWVNDPLSWAATLYILCVLVISTIVSVSCWAYIEFQMRRGNRSSNSMKAQHQLNTVLAVQFTLPFLTIHIPFYVSFLMPLFRVGTTHMSIYLPYLFSWCPALNPILVLLMVKNIRRQIFVNIWKVKSSTHSAGNMAIKPKSATSRINENLVMN